MPTDYLLEIDGIKGESGDGKIKDAIAVESFGWGVANRGTHGAGGGGGAGKASFSDLSFTTGVGIASPLLMLACATGQHIKKATLHVRKAGGEQEVYYMVSLTDVLVSSYQTGDAPGGDAAVVDSFSLNFAKIKFEYKPQKAEGGLGSAITAGYDLAANKKL